MRIKLAGYSLDDVGGDVADLEIYENNVHLLVFCKSVIKYVRLSLRKECGIELFSFRDETEWINFCHSTLKNVRRIDNDMALILINNSIRREVIQIENSRSMKRS